MHDSFVPLLIILLVVCLVQPSGALRLSCEHSGIAPSKAFQPSLFHSHGIIISYYCCYLGSESFGFICLIPHLTDLRVSAEIGVRRRHVLAHVRRRRGIRIVQVPKT